MGVRLQMRFYLTKCRICVQMRFKLKKCNHD